MSNERFTQEEQTEIVRMAATLEIAVEDEKKELSKLYSQKYKNPPVPPTRRHPKTQAQQFQVNYAALPKFNITYDQYLQEQCRTKPTLMNKIYSDDPYKRGLILTAGLGFAWLVLLSMLDKSLLIGLLSFICMMCAMGALPGAYMYNSKYKQKYMAIKNSADQQIQASPAYQETKLQAERQAQEATQQSLMIHQQELAQIQSDYEKALEDYNKRIIPQYEAAKQKWTENQNLKIQMIRNDLAENEQKLNSLYNQTKLISTHFRDIPKLVWIYEEMSSSQHDLDMSIQLLNDDTTHNLLRGVISHVDHMHNDMMRGMESIFMQLDAINNNTAITHEMLDEMSEGLRKTRRDMNIGNIVATYQRRKFRKEFNEFRNQFI